MDGRGDFVDVNTNNFAFVEGGQTYFAIGMIDDTIKVLERPNISVKAPEMSHTENRIYAIVQKGKLKHIAFYDDNHEMIRCIDFEHFHDNLKPHVHYDIKHEGKVTAPSEYDNVIIEKVRNWIELNRI